HAPEVPVPAAGRRNGQYPDAIQLTPGKPKEFLRRILFRTTKGKLVPRPHPASGEWCGNTKSRRRAVLCAAMTPGLLPGWVNSAGAAGVPEEQPSPDAPQVASRVTTDSEVASREVWRAVGIELLRGGVQLV